MKKEYLVHKTNDNCFIYVRVSTARQSDEGYSLDAQIKTCSEYAKSLNFSIKDIFREEGETATAADRPAFQNMIERCETGEVGAVIVYLTDRFARSEIDHYLIKDKMRKCGVKLYSATQEMLNGDGPEAHLMDGIMASINAFYSRDNSRKTIKGMMQKFEEGCYPGWAPLGYSNIVDEVTKKHHVIVDELNGPLVKIAFELYLTGSYSIYSLCQKLDELGLKGRLKNKLCTSSLQQMLKNPFYWGLMKWKGKEKMGKYTPLIDKELFDKVQNMLARHRDFLVRNRKFNFLLRGLVRCETHNKRFVGEWHKINSLNRAKIAYYHCYARGGCPGSYMEMETLENAVADLFKNLQFKKSFIDQIIQEANNFLDTIKNKNKNAKLGIENKIKGLETKREKLEGLLIDGTVDKEVFRRQHDKVQSQIDVCYRQIIDVERDRGIDIKFIEETLSLTRNIYNTFVSVSPELKRRYIFMFFDKITVQDKKIAKVEYRPLFKALLEEQTRVILRPNLLPGVDSNHEPYS